MNVLYVAPRYHTNQVPIMRGWLQNGHRVMFISQLTSPGENHNDVKPIVLGYSAVFNFWFRKINKMKKRNDPDEMFAVSSKKGFPPYFKLKKLIQDFKPDVAILRERSLYNIIVYAICKRCKIPAILYNQSPVWQEKRDSNPLLRRLVRSLSPKYRITVSEGTPGSNMVRDPHTYYVSFVMEPHFQPEEKTYCKDGIVHFLCVGRFMECKNHLLMIDVCSELLKKYPLHLTLVGEVRCESQEEYYASVLKLIEEKQMGEHITLIRNATQKTVFEEYKKADIFLLPSEEKVSISQLEAMSCSLPVICSNLHGKATYVKNEVNGYLVEVNNRADLLDKMEKLILDKDRMSEMGRKSFELVMEKSSFQNYYDHIMQILDDMKNGDGSDGKTI